MADDAALDPSRPILCLANGNMNGRVLRLVADGLRRHQRGPVRVVTTTRLHPLERWPEEKADPYVLEPDVVDGSEVERLVEDAAVFVLSPFWDGWVRHLVGKARRAGTPVVAVIADIGYGARKLDASDEATLPDWVCVGDPITRVLLIQNGIPASMIRNAGSPYFDALLSHPPLPPPPGGALRVGVFANPDGVHERVQGAGAESPEGVIPALGNALRTSPDAHITVRLHPRQKLDRIHTAFALPASAVFDPVEPASTVSAFVAAHHLLVGSYSMGLLVARLLGRPTVSFQPPMGDDDGLRREIFAEWDVPVATDEAGFAAHIAERLELAGAPLDPATVLYHPGTSLDAITHVVLDAQSSRRGAVAGGPVSRASSVASAVGHRPA